MKKTLLGYVPESSPAYEFHPVTRFSIVTLFTLIPLLTLNIPVNLGLILIVIALFPISRIPLSSFRFYLPVYGILALFIGVIYTLLPDESVQQTVWWSGYGIVVYREAVVFALSVYLRIAAVVTLTVYFLQIMTEREIVVAVRTLGVPYVGCYTLGLAFRAMGMFLNDYRTIREAEKARALDLGELPVHKKIVKLINYVVPLLALMIRRTDEFSNAISSRAFSLTQTQGRPNYLSDKYPFRTIDTIGIGTASVFTIGLLIILQFLG